MTAKFRLFKLILFALIQKIKAKCYMRANFLGPRCIQGYLGGRGGDNENPLDMADIY